MTKLNKKVIKEQNQASRTGKYLSKAAAILIIKKKESDNE